MPFTEQEQVEIREQFAARRKRQIVLAIPIVLLIGMAMLLRQYVDGSVFGLSPSAFGAMFLALVVAALVFSFTNWRCPGCNTYLGRGINPRFCGKCGVRLQ